MTAHKHVEIITAKANNTDLVVFFRNDGKWRELPKGCFPLFHNEYFLCLPKHKKECLHWLNGGECLVSYESVNGVSGVVNAKNTLREWTPNSLFMNHKALIKIESKKEKCFIVVHNGRVVDCLYKHDSEIRRSYGSKHDPFQIIEVEIEV